MKTFGDPPSQMNQPGKKLLISNRLCIKVGFVDKVLRLGKFYSGLFVILTIILSVILTVIQGVLSILMVFLTVKKMDYDFFPFWILLGPIRTWTRA